MFKKVFSSHTNFPSSILRRFSIKNRLLVAFLITSLLPVVIVAVYSNVKYESAITHKINEFANQILIELRSNTTRELEQYETLSETIIVNKYAQDGLPNFHEMLDFEKNTLKTFIMKDLSQQIFQLSNITDVIIMTTDHHIVYDVGFEIYPDEELKQLTAASTLSNGNNYWSHLKSNRGDKITLTRMIFDEENLNKVIGYVIIVIDEKIFSRNTLENVTLGKGSKLYLTDSSGTVVSSMSSDIKKGEKFEQQQIFEKITGQYREKLYYATVNGGKTLVVSTYLRSANWYLIGLVPHSYLVSELINLRDSVVLFCLITLMLSGTISIWIYYSIHHPIGSLLQYATEIRSGKLEKKLIHSHPDEMGKLTETINDMVEQLKQLVFQVEAEQHAKREAELKMLQAQINPHFLFNTLNSLKWSAMMSGNETVREGLESLSVLLRNTILVKEELITLEDEINNLLHYSTIQRIRYGDSFLLTCKMSDDTLYNCLIPKFILQPIVENSILHAGSENGNRVSIEVYGIKEGSTLKIYLSDNGKGFNVNDLYESRNLSHSKISGIGIDNVNERIRLHFGNKYGLVTQSTINEGTKTVITLPILTKEGQERV